MKVFVVHIFDGAGRLHDYYVHDAVENALLQAAADVVGGRFEDADPDFFEAELQRVLSATRVDPKTGRQHVRCDAWGARIDEMQVRV